MAHYAFLDENNFVTEVIVGRDEGELDIDWEKYYGDFRGQTCKRTSYNTRDGINTRTGGPGFRQNYAGIGYIFRDDINPPEGAFLPPDVPADSNQ